jgi:hypothetical protein
MAIEPVGVELLWLFAVGALLVVAFGEVVVVGVLAAAGGLTAPRPGKNCALAGATSMKDNKIGRMPRSAAFGVPLF